MQSGNVLLDSANIALGDDIELQFGTGTDLKIYHDGSHSYIEDAGTGNLKIQGSQVDIIGSGETMATFVDDGAVTLYHNNVAILATAATGISVTGDVTATDDLILDNDSAVIQLGDDQDVTLTHVADTGILLNSTRQLQFGDSGTYIHQSADGVLDLVSDTEIEINATTIDVNGNLDVSGTYTGGGLMTTGGNIVIPDAGNIGSASDTNAIGISSGGVVSVTATTANTSASDGALTVAGGLGVAADVSIGDDLRLISDASVLSFGADSEVTLTHVHDTGLILNAAMVVQFRDSAINIGSPADGDLDINADDEIELNSTLIDINGNVDISGTALITGVATHGGNVVSDTDSTDDLGTTGVRWANLYVDAITATDQITATGFTGTLDGILGSGAAAAATTTTLASTTITASGIVKTDDTTDATSTTDGSLQTDGGLSVALDAVLGNDVKLLSDASVLSFGGNSEVTLTHVHNDGLLLNDDMQLQFRDSAINIRSDADGDLDINADDEIELNSTLIDINGNIDASGTYTGAGLMTTGGNIVIPDGGNIGVASDTNAMSISSIGIVSLTATNAMKLNVGTTAQRPTGAAGLIRYNTTTSGFEGYGAAWGALGGGATGGGGDTVFIENEDDVTTDYTITSGSNAMCVGPITVEAGVTVTVPTGNRWIVF